MGYNYHLFAGTEGNSEFCGSGSLLIVKRGEAEFNNRLEGPQNSLFLEVPVNK